MGIMEPEDADDIFARLVNDLPYIDPVMFTEHAVSTLRDGELLQQFVEVKEELDELGEKRHPVTQKGRDLHSRYGALKIEIHKRGLL